MNDFGNFCVIVKLEATNLETLNFCLRISGHLSLTAYNWAIFHTIDQGENSSSHIDRTTRTLLFDT